MDGTRIPISKSNLDMPMGLRYSASEKMNNDKRNGKEFRNQEGGSYDQ
jgi:hypothetical protein